MTRRRLRAGATVLVCCAAAWLAAATRAGLEPPPLSLQPAAAVSTRFLDRHGEPLNATYPGGWNVHDIVPLHEIPPLLRQAFIHAEDKRFYMHHGPDWIARLAALWTDVTHVRAIRGASTISEQAVRMLVPRPRTVWTRWLEGFEATRLERRFSKDEILEFYLNQVPYAANRRGVRQAADYYFARDLATLSPREMLMLAVLVRSPSRLDPYRSADASAAAIARLARSMTARGALSAADRDAILHETVTLRPPELPVSAPHFLAYVRSTHAPRDTRQRQVVTTLDAAIQRTVQQLLDRRVDSVRGKRVENGAVLVTDVATGDVLAWAVAGGGAEDGPRSYIDAVTLPRQPGSSLKPFLYALALDSGSTAADVIDDSPLAEPVGAAGFHRYTNYSGRYYGPVTLRHALGNSLNIPAVRTLQRVGVGRYLDTLRSAGFDSLDAHPDFYGDGLALGNGEVSLLELAQGYTALANAGVFRPLRVLMSPDSEPAAHRIYTPEAASLIADILSDPSARTLEFGSNSVLSMPVPTAVKTGTSSDFRDAWAVGFDSRHVVGIWMGNVDQRPTDGLTGSTGPALLLRSVFSTLRRSREAGPLYLSPGLTQRRVCVPAPSAPQSTCLERDEWFMPGHRQSGAPEPARQEAVGRSARGLAPGGRRPGSPEAGTSMPGSSEARSAGIRGLRATAPGATVVTVRQPVPGLLLALDPRLPREAQAYEFLIDGIAPGDEVHVRVGRESWVASAGHFLWPLAPGRHEVQTSVWHDGRQVDALDPFTFTVR